MATLFEHDKKVTSFQFEDNQMNKIDFPIVIYFLWTHKKWNILQIKWNVADL